MPANDVQIVANCTGPVLEGSFREYVYQQIYFLEKKKYNIYIYTYI